jgi:hypothetical protein
MRVADARLRGEVDHHVGPEFSPLCAERISMSSIETRATREIGVVREDVVARFLERDVVIVRLKLSTPITVAPLLEQLARRYGSR